MTTTPPRSAADVLAFARDSRVAADRAEADVLLAAVTWAEQHPPESIHDAATWSTRGGDCPLPLAGDGAPLVAEFCIAEFAAAIGRSTDSGRIKIAHGLELKYRLPRHWARVRSGTLEPWRACRVAAATLALNMDAAAYVDAQLVAFAHKVGPAQLDRLVEQAIARFMPEQAAENAERAAEDTARHLPPPPGLPDGTTWMQAQLDLADALDLDAAITTGAEHSASPGPPSPRRTPRHRRRPLARRQLGLDLRPTPGGRPAAPGSAKRRQVVLYVHLSEAAITGTQPARRPGAGAGRQPPPHRPRRPGPCLVRHPDTNVVVKPVIDLDEHLGVAGYEVPERLAEQTQVRDGTCTFPWCTRPALDCDSEHCHRLDQGGTTCSCNIAPLCRRHHRLKTHTPWTYTAIDPGTYLWTSPHGYQFLRDRHGTTDVTHDLSRPPPGSTDHPTTDVPQRPRFTPS